MEYTIQRTDQSPLDADWDTAPWNDAELLTVSHFHPARPAKHQPLTQAKVLYDAEGVYVFFRVEDHYVRAVQTGYNANVCWDSCVEFFVEPVAGKGYFNFEINAGGHLLCSYGITAAVAPDGEAASTPLTDDQLDQVTIHHSLPSVVEPEITEPTTWTIRYRVPIQVLEDYVGPIGDPVGQTWRANFYKCGDQTSHPHWASWAPLGDVLSFHLPEYFQPIRFAK